MRRVRPWFAEDGDYTYRLNYDSLDKNSIVVDLGGYKGQWASDIFSKYQSRVFVFEPVAAYFNFIKDRFKANPNISVFQLALGNRNISSEIFKC
jgi:hypothetical protein